jgi:hypothetical protein
MVELKHSSVGQLIANNGNGWEHATLEQVNLWNCFVSMIQVRANQVDRIVQEIGVHLLSMNRSLREPHASVVSVINNSNGKSYQLAPGHLKGMLTRCVVPCK